MSKDAINPGVITRHNGPHYPDHSDAVTTDLAPIYYTQHRGSSDIGRQQF